MLEEQATRLAGGKTLEHASGPNKLPLLPDAKGTEARFPVVVVASRILDAISSINAKILTT